MAYPCRRRLAEGTKEFMAAGADPNPKSVSPSELDGLLEQARAAGWRELGLLGPFDVQFRPGGVPETHTFFLHGSLGAADLVKL
jgi:hypothetical protein